MAKTKLDQQQLNDYNFNFSLARQALINGNFDVWQRGTSIALSSSTGLFLADRWNISSANTNNTASRQTAGLNGSTYSLRIQRANGNSGTNIVYVTQNLESVNSMKFRGKKMTLSFYARAGANYSPTSGNLVATIQSGTGTDENCLNLFTNGAAVGTSTVQLTTSWVKYTVTTTNILDDTVNQLAVIFSSTPTGTAGANDWFEITQVQLCAGDVALPFMPKSYDEEEKMCKRYYEKIGAEASGTYPRFTSGHNISTTVHNGILWLSVPKRINTWALETSGTASHYAIWHASTATACSVVPATTGVNEQTKTSASISFTVASGLTAGQGSEGMGNNSASAYLAANAEL